MGELVPLSLAGAGGAGLAVLLVRLAADGGRGSGCGAPDAG